MSKKDGGPAFPVKFENPGTEAIRLYGFDLPPKHTFRAGGMSIRDYFAGQAMAGLAALWEKTPGSATEIATAAAAVAYTMADAMLAERERQE